MNEPRNPPSKQATAGFRAPPKGIRLSGFSLVELLVVVAVIGLLLALLLPTFSRSKGAARLAVCKSNLRQIGIGLNAYVGDFQKYPASWQSDHPTSSGQTRRSVQETLGPYCDGLVSQPCPSKSFYGYNDSGVGHAGAYDGFGNPVPYTESDVPPEETGESFGLGRVHPGGLAVPESLVARPSDMIAFVHTGMLGTFIGFGWPGVFAEGKWAPHSRDPGLFCDGHVEASNRMSIPHETNSFGRRDFVPDTLHTRRWNRDNEPHLEHYRPR